MELPHKHWYNSRPPTKTLVCVARPSRAPIGGGFLLSYEPYANIRLLNYQGACQLVRPDAFLPMAYGGDWKQENGPTPHKR